MKEMYRMIGKQMLGIAGAMAVLAFGTEKLHAQPADVNESCTFAATLVINNTNSTYNSNTTAYVNPPPTMVKMATKDILALIAKGEHKEGNWTSTNFPTGAKLMKYGTPGNFVDFFVAGATNNELVDCQDIISMNGQYEDLLAYTFTGTANESTPWMETDYGFAEVDIYDLGLAGGVTDLQLYGYFVNTIKTTAVSQATGMIGNSQSFGIKAIGGEGAIGNNDNPNCAVSGSLSALGSQQTF